MKKLLLLIFFALFPVLAHGGTYYVAKTGSDSNSCAQAQNVSTAKLTLAAGLSCLSGGDKLTMKAGTYTDTDIVKVPSGSASTPTVIQAASGETVVVQPTACSQGGGNSVLFDGTSYITLQGPGLIIDGSSCGLQSANGIGVFSGAHHIVLQDIEVRNTNGVGIDFYHFPTDIRVTRVKVHDTGRFSTQSPPQAYGMYLNGRRNIIENSEVYNTAGWGIHAYSGYADGEVAEFTIRNNWIHNTNGPNSDINGAGGILLWAANALGGIAGENRVYNNIISNTNNTNAAISLAYGNGTNYVYNNTIYSNQGGGSSIALRSSASGWKVQNNILYNNSNNSISNDGSGNTVDHNLLGTDPLFVNAAGNDFNLQPSSPAIDAGVVIVSGQQYNGSTPDLGAFEFGAGGQRNAPRNLRVVAY